MSLEYIRNTYGVPAKRGGIVEYSGAGRTLRGVITGADGAHVRVRLEGGKFSMKFHPTWKLRYLQSTAGADAA